MYIYYYKMYRDRRVGVRTCVRYNIVRGDDKMVASRPRLFPVRTHVFNICSANIVHELIVDASWSRVLN